MPITLGVRCEICCFLPSQDHPPERHGDIRHLAVGPQWLETMERKYLGTVHREILMDFVRLALEVRLKVIRLQPPALMEAVNPMTEPIQTRPKHPEEEGAGEEIPGGPAG
ncbi:hypothetical protein EOD39_13354 [Acipenser ruthenus]|uniref:Uncharacterized protein n=1 Tax=Acipenser ruthenus TaxID=7906 RepID=A0A662YP83_ACIRT|nr:hypothetical protein EOD39_13354 [Acipenser ruthenus]